MPTKKPEKELSPEEIRKIDQIGEIAKVEKREKTISSSGKVDVKTLQEVFNLELERRDYEKRKRNLTIGYVGRLFWLIVFWLIAVMVYIGFAGFKYRDFSLDNSVLIALITSTTATVLGLFIYVAKWLYPTTQKQEDSDKKDNQNKN
jgi:hypothetical protein